MVLMRYDNLVKEEQNNSMAEFYQQDIEMMANNDPHPNYFKPSFDKPNIYHNGSNNDAASTNLDTSFNQSTISSRIFKPKLHMMAHDKN